jgi:hypothetical protein
MRCLLILSVALALAAAPPAAFAQSPSPVVSPTAAAAATVDPAITGRAKDWFHRMQTGSIDRAQLTADMNAALTDAVAKQTAAQLSVLGDPSEFAFVDRTVPVPKNTSYTYRLKFAVGALTYIFSLDDAGKISGLRLAPAP